MNKHASTCLSPLPLNFWMLSATHQLFTIRTKGQENSRFGARAAYVTRYWKKLTAADMLPNLSNVGYLHSVMQVMKNMQVLN